MPRMLWLATYAADGHLRLLKSRVAQKLQRGTKIWSHYLWLLTHIFRMHFN